MEEMTEKQKDEFDAWVNEREAELFKVDSFKKLGKEHDYFFQILCFMGKASEQMSLAFTLTEHINEFPPELANEFREVAIQYQELQEKVRNLRQG